MLFTLGRGWISGFFFFFLLAVVVVVLLLLVLFLSERGGERERESEPKVRAYSRLLCLKVGCCVVSVCQQKGGLQTHLTTSPELSP